MKSYRRFPAFDRFATEGGSACPQDDALDSPKAQLSGGKAAYLSQPVEDNAFHLRKPTREELTPVAGLSIVSQPKVDRLVLKTMSLDSPKALISGGKARVR